ncbi:hypothetical protein P3S67_015900 [Capsicum chacoense]
MLDGGCDHQVNSLRDIGASYLPDFFYMIDTRIVGSTYYIMMNRHNCRFMYYILALGICIKGFVYMRKIIVVNNPHLHGKYEGVMLSMVVRDTENHVYLIAFCIIDKKNEASWTFFFKKLKSIVVDGPTLCFIFDKHKSIANDIAKAYNHAHHGYCMSHLGENLWVNHQCRDYLYLFYHATKTYSFEEFNDYFEEFKNYCPKAAFFLKHELGFEKWSRAYFSDNRYNVMTTNIIESINTILIAEREYYGIHIQFDC